MVNFLIQQGLRLDTFDIIGDWTISTGSAQVVNGGLELTSAVGSFCAATKTISQSLANRGTMKVAIAIANSAALANIDAIEIYISSTTDFSKYFKFSMFSSSFHEGTNEILINRTTWANTGGEDWANTMVRLRVRVNAKAAVQAVLRFDSLYAGYYSRPKCIFNFDDGYASVYTKAYPYLRKYGFKGSTFVNSNLVESNGSYMTRAQLDELYAAGWDIGNHTHTHPHLDQQSAATIQSELDSCTTYLKARGYIRNNMHKHFVYPYGDYNQTVINEVTNRSFLTARTTISNRTQVNNLDNPYLLLWQGVSVGNAAAAKAALDRTIADGGVVMWGLHAIADTPGQAWEWDTASFQELVDYVASKREQVDVVTTTEWYYGLTSARRMI